MPPITQAVLLDFASLAAVITAVGLAAHAGIRFAFPLLQWDRRGNVWTAPFNGIDLGIAILLILLARFLVLSNPGTDEQELTSVGLLSGALFLLAVAAGLAALLAIRGHHLVELFGLARFELPALVRRVLVGTFVAGGAVYAFQYALRFVLHPSWTEAESQQLVEQLATSGDPGLRVVIVLCACLIIPVAEEVIFRGYLYPALKRFSDPWLAALVSAMVFAVLHLHVPSLLPLCLFGLLLTAAYEWTGSLWVPVSIHTLFNTFTVVFVLVNS